MGRSNGLEVATVGKPVQARRDTELGPHGLVAAGLFPCGSAGPSWSSTRLCAGLLRSLCHSTSDVPAGTDAAVGLEDAVLNSGHLSLPYT